MPSPQKGEKRKEFISRCIGCDEMVDKFPEQKQRIAVCYSYADKHYKGVKESENKITFKEFLTERRVYKPGNGDRDKPQSPSK